MTRRIMSQILKKKTEDWLSSIQDDNVRNQIKNDKFIITGGAIVSFLIGEKPKDYDIYFEKKETAKQVAIYYVNEFKKLHPEKTNGLVFEVLDGEEIQNDVDKYAHIAKTTPPERIRIFIQSQGAISESDEEIDPDNYEDPVETMDRADDISEDMIEEKPPYRPVYLSPNAITLANHIQLIIRFYGTPEDIHSTYDYVHCTCYWDYGTGKIILPEKALESILAKRLYYIGSKYPLCSMIRMRKFLKRGWYISAGEILKIAYQISDLDLRDLTVLDDQLVGVDSAYFHMLIQALEKKQKEEGFQLTYPYVATLIDKIFG